MENILEARFEHIATRIPLEIKITEHEFNLLTARPISDKDTDQAWLSMWLRNTDINTGGDHENDIDNFFKDFFFEGVYKNNELRSH